MNDKNININSFRLQQHPFKFYFQLTQLLFQYCPTTIQQAKKNRFINRIIVKKNQKTFITQKKQIMFYFLFLKNYLMTLSSEYINLLTQGIVQYQ